MGKKATVPALELESQTEFIRIVTRLVRRDSLVLTLPMQLILRLRSWDKGPEGGVGWKTERREVQRVWKAGNNGDDGGSWGKWRGPRTAKAGPWEKVPMGSGD